jgi:hypothetical protein
MCTSNNELLKNKKESLIQKKKKKKKEQKGKSFELLRYCILRMRNNKLIVDCREISIHGHAIEIISMTKVSFGELLIL